MNEMNKLTQEKICSFWWTSSKKEGHE